MREISESERRGRRQRAAFDEAVAEWARLASLTEPGGGWRDWCGHNLLGKRPPLGHECVPEHGWSGWWDHPRCFRRGRRPVAVLAWPYGYRGEVESSLSAYAADLGLGWYLGDPWGHMSIYFPGSTTPWILTAPGENAAELLALSSPRLVDLMREQRAYADWRNRGASP